ncbi:hypothetical protein LSTR_LSTR004716 [Laodelphax striatellus]|uniref:Uncharacterized protein n=1 Tax=Laodelphax striatellus TaxID=195883 RepID=A0A482WU80_LAOST|nr:hypothetical protein LSTR_LSTR004716 [Laodelphax striatellus]
MESLENGGSKTEKSDSYANGGPQGGVGGRRVQEFRYPPDITNYLVYCRVGDVAAHKTPSTPWENIAPATVNAPTLATIIFLF